MRFAVVVLTRIWKSVRSGRKPPTTVRIFRQASRDRDEGRFEEAADLVETGLRLDPDNLVGLLLAGSLHTVFREMHLAKTAFERVLSIDRAHPRALLGLARIALEEAEPGTCTELLQRALDRYPDFPEARALLDVVRTASEQVPQRPGPPVAALRVDRLRVPSDSREALLARIDATLIFAQPRGSRTEELAARTAQLCRLAAAMLTRCGLGPMHHAVIEGAAETTYLRADGQVVLSMAFGRDVELAAGLVHLERVWSNCRQELAIEVA
ncbi:MAG: tetratricopeptide repeat protein [Candidatus Rokuibacteriota bacterium]